MKFQFLFFLFFLFFFQVEAQTALTNQDTIYYFDINKNASAGTVNGQGCFISLISTKKGLYYYNREISLYYPSGTPMIYGRSRGRYCVGIWVYTEDVTQNVIKFKSFKKKDKVPIPRTLSGFVDLFQ